MLTAEDCLMFNLLHAVGGFYVLFIWVMRSKGRDHTVTAFVNSVDMSQLLIWGVEKSILTIHSTSQIIHPPPTLPLWGHKLLACHHNVRPYVLVTRIWLHGCRGVTEGPAYVASAAVRNTPPLSNGPLHTLTCCLSPVIASLSLHLVSFTRLLLLSWNLAWTATDWWIESSSGPSHAQVCFAGNVIPLLCFPLCIYYSLFSS